MKIGGAEIGGLLNALYESGDRCGPCVRHDASSITRGVMKITRLVLVLCRLL